MPRVSIKKNYYELKKIERREYLEEFNDISYAKKVKNKKDFAVYLSLIFIILFIVSKFVDFDVLIPCLSFYVRCIALVILLYYVFLESFYRICFMRWLKIKHKVEF